MKKRLVFINTFHNTSATMAVKFDGPHYVASKSTVNKIKRKLCGMHGCQCGGNFGERGGLRVPYVIFNDDKAIFSVE